jgi:hypothetical protein
VNPSETQPVVNVSLTASIQQYNIDLRFDGSVDKMRTQYSSDPALPEADIIHLLALGQTIHGQCEVSPRVALSATRDPNGGVAFDMLVKKT